LPKTENRSNIVNTTQRGRQPEKLVLIELVAHCNDISIITYTQIQNNKLIDSSKKHICTTYGENPSETNPLVTETFFSKRKIIRLSLGQG